MSFVESFLKEFDPEMATTRRMLERVPAEKFGWRPHGKSKSLGELATHITEVPRFGTRIREGDEFAAGTDAPPPMKNAPELLARFDENVRKSREAIASMSDESLEREFTVTRNQQPFFTLKKRAMLRRVLMNHLIHHRGQLSVYLRLNDVPLPAVYGPTADEGI
jgi:uncharacterized damage-inducible protein DinB